MKLVSQTSPITTGLLRAAGFNRKQSLPWKFSANVATVHSPVRVSGCLDGERGKGVSSFEPRLSAPDFALQL